MEKQAILNTLRSNGDKLTAAKLLGIGKTTLYRKLKEYGIADSRKSISAGRRPSRWPSDPNANGTPEGGIPCPNCLAGDDHVWSRKLCRCDWTTVGRSVEVAGRCRIALPALRRREYAVMVLDEAWLRPTPGAEVLWQQAGLAVPIQVNLGISGCNRVLREVRAALQRRERELSLSMRAAAQIMEGEMNTKLTGLLLKTQLALQDPTLTPGTVITLRQVVELAGELRELIRTPPVVLSEGGPPTSAASGAHMSRLTA